METTPPTAAAAPDAGARLHSVARLQRRGLRRLLALLCILPALTCALAGEPVALTAAEEGFLREHRAWRMAGESAAPFQWLDANHELHGLAADFLALIRTRLSVAFEPVPAESWNESLAQMRRKECDLALLTVATEERASYLLFTEPLLVLTPAIITRNDDRAITGLADLRGRRVAVMRSWATHEWLLANAPTLVLVPREDAGSALASVATADCDAFIGDLFTASYAIERLGLRNLKVAGDVPIPNAFRIAVRNDWPEAVSILNKVIAAVTPEEHAAIRRKWIAIQSPTFSLRKVLLYGVPSLIAAFALTLFIANRRLKREIGQRRRTEQALRESEERWSFALEGSRDGVWDWNVQTKQVFFSRQWKAMLGYADDELRDELAEWTSRVHPEDLDLALERIQEHLRGGTEFYQLEHRVQAKDGSWRWVLARGRVVTRDANGAPSRMVGTHTEITDRKESELALQRVQDELRRHQQNLEQTVEARTAELKLAGERIQAAEKRLREITNQLPGAVYQFVRDAEGSFAFTFCSAGTAEVLGVSAEEAVRDVKAVWAVIHPDDLAELIRKADYSAETMTRYVQDLRICQPDGRRWWIRAESEPQRQPDGTMLWNGNIMDITERKRLEQELAVAKTAAEAANRAKSAFLANMSHEIRTPMNAILGFSSLLLRDPAIGGVPRQNLKTIHRSGEHLLELINEILEMSKIEAGRVELRHASFDLHALLEELERMFQVRADERGIGLRIEREPAVPQSVAGDEAKLRQIFINLIGNAVKFTERGSVHVRLAVGELGANDVCLRAEIADTGAGIAAEELPRLFQQFEQTATGRRTGGTGLGLAISREFIRLMGGDIQVESEPGRGSTFRFHFRLALSSAELTAQRTADERRVLRVHGPPDALRILIADDTVENGELLEQTLQAVGFETRFVTNGEAAVRESALWRPRVILMDLRMPGISGDDAIRRIRAQQNGSPLAILAVTASVFEEDRQQVFDAGGDDFLGKPLRESVLFAKLQQHAGVEYEYTDDQTAAAPATARQLTTTEVQAALSAETRSALRSAIISADLDKVLALLDEAAAECPAVAAVLRERVEHFDYQGALDLLGSDEGPAQTGAAAAHESP